jgi:hypothetical protein
MASSLVWLWWVIDLARFEFKSGTVSFCFSFIFVSFGESRLLVSWCAGGRCDMACSDENRGRSRKPGAEDQGWSHRSGTRLSHPGSRKLNWSLHTCAQDVQITRTANNMVNRYNISLNYKLESLQNDPWVQKKYYRVTRKFKRRCVFHRHNRRRGRPSLYLLAPAGTLGWTPVFCST